MAIPSAKVLSKNKVRELARLKQKKYRRQCQQFLVEGIRLCRELLASSIPVHAVIFTQKLLAHPYGQEILQQAAKRQIEIFESTEKNLLPLTDTCQPQPIVVCATTRCYNIESDFSDIKRLVVLADVGDPGNVGTLLRSAEAFSWDGVVLAGSSAELYNPKVLRASMGAAFRLKIACSKLETLVSFFEYTGMSYFVSTPAQGKLPPYTDLPERLAIFLGNEAHGLPKSSIKQADAALRLPMSSTVESLNVAVAGSILLFLINEGAKLS